jgi:porin
MEYNYPNVKIASPQYNMEQDFDRKKEREFMKNLSWCSMTIFLFITAAYWSCIGADACAETPTDLNSTKLTGDWWGQRAKLAEQGVTFDISATQYYQGVLQGGTNQSWKYGGLMDYRVHFDFQKMGLWQGAFLDIQAMHQFGEFINTDTGMLVPVNSEGALPLPDYRQVNVSQVKYTQFLSESFALYFGKINTMIDYKETAFTGGEGKTTFMNLANIFQPVALRTVPLSALGGGAVVFLPDVTTKDHATLSITGLGANGQPNTSGFDEDFEDGQAFMAAYNQPSRFFDKPGNHLFVTTYSTKDYAMLDQNSRLLLDALLGYPVTLDKGEDSWSLMYNMHQYVYTEQEDETQGFGFFGRLGTADDKTNPVANFYGAGLGGKGTIHGRDNDTWGVGYFYMQLSKEFGRAIEQNFGDAQGLEVFYNIELTKSVHISPDFQVLEPSSDHVDRTYIAGMRAKIDF